jgi:hypothetical protein
MLTDREYFFDMKIQFSEGKIVRDTPASIVEGFF